MLLARLVPLVTLEANLSSYSVLELLEMRRLDYVLEAAHSVYLKHVYNSTMAETFLGDELFGAVRIVPIDDICSCYGTNNMLVQFFNIGSDLVSSIHYKLFSLNLPSW